MTLKECYQILDLNQSASLEEVKRAYRQRAFALHPDLNPGIADASRQFQRLNEAYVILSKLIAVREERDKKKSGQAQRERAQEAPRSEEGSSSTASGAEATKTANQKARENTAAHDSASASHEQPSAASESAASASATSASATAAPS
ncbi:MAG: J domain-containing protein, partial [Bilophila sp.]